MTPRQNLKVLGINGTQVQEEIVSVRIRLKRFGTNKRPYYRIVVMDSRTKRDGKALEVVGLYHPIEVEEKQVRLDTERIQAWLQQGAIPSPTVKRILNKHQIFLT